MKTRGVPYREESTERGVRYGTKIGDRILWDDQKLAFQILRRVKRRIAGRRYSLEREQIGALDALGIVKLESRAYQCLLLERMIDKEIKKLDRQSTGGRC